MKKENRLRYILPENRTVRIVLAVFFWLLAAACAGCIFWLSSRDGNQSKDMSDNVRGILAKILGSPLGSFIVRKFAHFFEYAALGFLIGCALSSAAGVFRPLSPSFAVPFIQSATRYTSILFRDEPAAFSMSESTPSAR